MDIMEGDYADSGMCLYGWVEVGLFRPWMTLASPKRNKPLNAVYENIPGNPSKSRKLICIQQWRVDGLPSSVN